MHKYTAILGLVFFLLSCASAPKQDYLELEGAVFTGRYEQAITQVDKARSILYPEKNAVMYMLDKGMLEHYAGRYRESSANLEEADRLIEEAYTKDFSDEFTSYLSKDAGKRAYNGEDFENIYSNLFAALNYYHQGDLENGLVEIRRMNEKLPYLSDTYAAQKTKILERMKDWIAGSEFNFSNSALARYLGLLFYRADGKFDDARIEAEEIANAFAAAPEVYRHAIPAPLVLDGNRCEELNIPEGKARLNVLGFLGLTPYKVAENNGYEAAVAEYLFGEKDMGSYDFDKAGNNSHINLAIRERSSLVDNVEVVFDDGKRFRLAMLEDIGKISSEMIRRRQERIEALANMKALLTLIPDLVVGVTGGMGKTMGKGLVYAFSGVSRRAQLRMIAKELKNEMKGYDTRMSRFFPEKALAGGITLDPGTYSFSINYYINGTLLKSERFEDVTVKADKLNLVEALHLSDDDRDDINAGGGVIISGFPKDGKYMLLVSVKGGSEEACFKSAAAYAELSISGGETPGRIVLLDTKTWERWTGSGRYYLYMWKGFFTAAYSLRAINFTNGSAEITLDPAEWIDAYYMGGEVAF